ncbi:uncharacterized protein LOC128225570 [Mya arenaria]|uniref:uncharacterized protein LOC128225570 n=1 Tax=Mya arenaria TaxID=6604 RepID=UPI0022E537B5|nr:uncharacterized protein LOC128225570 [Mya arenaria]
MTCPPCDKIHCSPKSAAKLDCQGGVTTGVCDCCPACARVSGERCGGYYYYLGKCDKGLYCEPTDKSKKGRNTRSHKSRQPEGICTKVPSQVKDQPPEQRVQCRHKCTPEFCTKHPRAICSAIDVAEFLQPCHAHCQHTSCSACRFVDKPDCRKCTKDDFRCLHKFGKCMRKETCSRKKFPCKEKYFSFWKKQKGKFQCFVPSC